jgi:putative copper export protein
MRLAYLAAVYLHIVTVAVWVGAILFEDPSSQRFFCRMAYKLRGIGGPSVVVLTATGAFMLFYRGVTWQEFSTGQFFAQRYGQLFGAKLVLFLILVGLQITIGNRPSKFVYGYLLLVLIIVALSVWLVRPIV